MEQIIRRNLRATGRRTVLGAYQYVSATGRPIAQRNSNGSVTVYHTAGQNNLANAQFAAQWFRNYRRNLHRTEN